MSSNGAPRPMKMGTMASPWRYDPVARNTLQPEIHRKAAIFAAAWRRTRVHNFHFSGSEAALD
jgi:hypothetical protein